MNDYSAPPSTANAAPGIDLSILSESYNLLRNRLGEMVKLSSLLFIVFSVIGGGLLVIWFGSIMAAMQAANDNPIAVMMAMYLNPAFWLFMVVSQVLPVMLQAGFSALVFQEKRGETPTFSEGIRMIKDNFGPLLLLSLIICGAYLALSFVCSLAAMAAQAAVFLSVPALLDQRLKPIDAIKYSYEKVKTCFWMVLALVILTSLISGLGGLLCLVGIIFTLPFTGLVPALTYLRIRQGEFGVFAEGSPYPRGGEPVVPATTSPFASSPETPRPADLYPETTVEAEPPTKPEAPQ